MPVPRCPASAAARAAKQRSASKLSPVPAPACIEPLAHLPLPFLQLFSQYLTLAFIGFISISSLR